MSSPFFNNMFTRLYRATGSSLHRRLVTWFGLMATVPAVLLIIFSALMLHYGVQVMFSDQVKTAVNNAQSVAESYYTEHRETIRADVLAMATDLDRQASLILANPSDLNRFLDTQSFLRNFNEVVLFTDDGRVIAQGGASLGFSPDTITLPARQAADMGQVAIFTQNNDERINALARLNKFDDTYIYATRAVDPQVISYVEQTREAATQFQNLEDRRDQALTQFLSFYIAVCVLVAAMAGGVGFYLAGQLSRPINRLIDAADQVRAGHLEVNIPEGAPGDDFSALNKTFNRMTAELLVQRRELGAAERKAAWADVARRVAHEIKNPLTPIQLSAERLRRRFLKNIPEADQGVYTQCLDTIVRHVGDIGRMVGEFASFARMPDPVLQLDDLSLILNDLVAMHQGGDGGDVPITLTGPALAAGALPIIMDAGQMRQALTNLILNARQAVMERLAKVPEPAGKIMIYVAKDDQHYMISVFDNGFGFPTSVPIERFGEPYVTFKEKGSGLGLAIVKKIVQDHKGAVRVNGPDGIREAAGWGEAGAAVTLILPIPLASAAEVKENSAYAA